MSDIQTNYFAKFQKSSNVPYQVKEKSRKAVQAFGRKLYNELVEEYGEIQCLEMFERKGVHHTLTVYKAVSGYRAGKPNKEHWTPDFLEKLDHAAALDTIEEVMAAIGNYF